MLSKKEILETRIELKREIVNVPEWGGDVIVSEMDGTTRDRFEFTIATRDTEGKVSNARAKLVAYCVVDEAGERIFSDEDIASLGKLPSVLLTRIAKIAQRLNGLTSADVIEAEKN